MSKLKLVFYLEDENKNVIDEKNQTIIDLDDRVTSAAPAAKALMDRGARPLETFGEVENFEKMRRQAEPLHDAADAAGLIVGRCLRLQLASILTQDDRSR